MNYNACSKAKRAVRVSWRTYLLVKRLVKFKLHINYAKFLYLVHGVLLLLSLNYHYFRSLASVLSCLCCQVHALFIDPFQIHNIGLLICSKNSCSKEWHNGVFPQKKHALLLAVVPKAQMIPIFSKNVHNKSELRKNVCSVAYTYIPKSFNWILSKALL